jgi:hypothetical protein
VRILSIAVLAGALLGAAPVAAENPQLVGSVGPGFGISLKDGGGVPVKRLDPGTYTLLVHDLSEEHNFHLSGPGVNVSTDVPFTGDQTFTITVTDGSYSFVCDVHASVMKGSFTVGSAPPPPAPLPKRIVLAVAGKITAPAHVAPGRWTVVVRDSSRVDNVHLTGSGVNRKTGVAFRGTVQWAVTLKPGSYRVSSDAHRTLARTIRVS